MLPVATILVASQPAQASPIAYEGFSMPFAAPFHGGAGFSGPWNNDSFPGTSGYSWSDSTLRITGFQTSGGSVSGDASVTTVSFATRELATLVTSYPTVYVSFLVQPRGTLNQGSFDGFFGLLLGGSSGQDVFVGKPGGGALEQYVLETVGGVGQVTSGVSAVVDRTALLVVKAQFSVGNDVFTLYVDPPVKGAEPASGAVKSDLDLGALSSIRIYSGGAFAIDEIRIGTTYADVVVPAK